MVCWDKEGVLEERHLNSHSTGAEKRGPDREQQDLASAGRGPGAPVEMKTEATVAGMH